MVKSTDFYAATLLMSDNMLERTNGVQDGWPCRGPQFQEFGTVVGSSAVCRPGKVQELGEVKYLSFTMAPLALMSLLQSLLVTINLHFVGHVRRTEITAASLACLKAKITGWDVPQGFATAFETLCLQVYRTGCKQCRIACAEDDTCTSRRYSPDSDLLVPLSVISWTARIRPRGL